MMLLPGMFTPSSILAAKYSKNPPADPAKPRFSAQTLEHNLFNVFEYCNFYMHEKHDNSGLAAYLTQSFPYPTEVWQGQLRDNNKIPGILKYLSGIYIECRQVCKALKYIAPQPSRNESETTVTFPQLSSPRPHSHITRYSWVKDNEGKLLRVIYRDNELAIQGVDIQAEFIINLKTGEYVMKRAIKQPTGGLFTRSSMRDPLLDLFRAARIENASYNSGPQIIIRYKNGEKQPFLLREGQVHNAKKILKLLTAVSQSYEKELAYDIQQNRQPGWKKWL